MDAKTKNAASMDGSAVGNSGLSETTKMENYWRIECLDKDGNLKWVEEYENLVTTGGLNDLITNYFKGSAYTAAFYVGLTSTSPTPAAGDTMASHGGWTEVVAYSQTTRPALSLGSVSAGSANNSGSTATFSVNANGTGIGGAFLTTNNTKSGTTGTLYGIGAFTGGDKTLSNGDTLNVTVTVTAS